MDRRYKNDDPRRRSHFFADPASLDVPANLGGAGEPRPLPLSQLDPFAMQRMRLEVWILNDLAPEPWITRANYYHPRIVKGIYRLLMHHHGVVSRLLIYHQLPDFLPPPHKDRARMLHKGFYVPPYRSKDQRHRRLITNGLSDGRRTGLWRVVKLDPNAETEQVPGRRCPVCKLHLSPGDWQCVRDTAAECGGPSTQE